MTEKGYNGWSSYQTWDVALWMGSDEGSSRHYDDLAQEAWDVAEPDETFTRLESATLTFAGCLQEAYEEAMADWLEGSHRSASVWADLLTAALGEVDWYEIAEKWLENVDKAEAIEAE